MTDHRVPRSLQHGSRKWKLAIMRRWAYEMGRGCPRSRRSQKGWPEAALETLWWMPRYDRYEKQP